MNADMIAELRRQRTEEEREHIAHNRRPISASLADLKRRRQRRRQKAWDRERLAGWQQ